VSGVQGFRNWKRRYVVLTREGDLRWYDKPHGDLRGELHLAGHACTVKDLAHLRWAVTDPATNSVREFAAGSGDEMRRWMEALERGIVASTPVLSPPPHPASTPPEPPARPETSPHGVEGLLKALDLQELLPLFEAAGYTSLQRMQEAGLEEVDLDYIGVEVRGFRKEASR
jgi:hypothetical protein